MKKTAEYLTNILNAISGLTWFMCGLLLIFATCLEIYYASAIEDLARANSNSIMYMREVLEVHFKECCR